MAVIRLAYTMFYAFRLDHGAAAADRAVSHGHVCHAALPSSAQHVPPLRPLGLPVSDCREDVLRDQNV